MNDQTLLNGHKRRDSVVLGIVLVVMGALFLLGQVLEIGLLILPMLAGAFLTAGIVTRAAGWFVPTGIVGGIGLGVVMMERSTLGNNGEAAMFLLNFALGWASITLLARVFSGERVRWPLIPAGVLALLGLGLLAGDTGERVLELVFMVFGYAWPIALVVAGVALLLKTGRAQ